MLQDLALGPDTVDVSMETLASVWTRDPCDPCDLSEKRQEQSSVWESQCVFNSSPPAGLMWTEQLSPHLQRNKQLQDTLVQREEELARLQEENNNLREFLNSSFVRNLEQKAKKLTADGRRKLKRNLMYVDDGPLQNCSHQLLTSQQVSKRVCRNLTAEFCSESSETTSSSEPNLDLWVLRTLGLKDRDTIDTSNDSSSSSGYSLCNLVYDAAVTSSSSSEYTFNSSFSPSIATSTPPSVHSCCQTSTHQTDYRYSAAECQGANCGNPAKSPQNCTTSPGQRSDFTATGLTRQYEAPEAVIRSYNTLTAFQSPPLTEELPFTQSPDRAEICSITAPSRVQTLEGNPAKHPDYWSPLRGSQTPSHDIIHFSPSRERVPFSPISSSSPVMNQLWTPVRGGSPTSLSAGSQLPATPQTPRSRTDLAFSMSLSPSSSVKTHSFPQGQAFVRKDTDGKWNFTWVPRQGP
ncbi:geminin coiled-coil domain-containing protein 1 isoform X2 [Siniperca chuatsi]|nr:geminin coiled-coil domain-containing protein 1 isoform X2 [Siniperca chuatsi]